MTRPTGLNLNVKVSELIMVKKKGTPLSQDKVRQLSKEFRFEECEVNPNDRRFKMRFVNNKVKHVDVFFTTGTVRLEYEDTKGLQKVTHSNVTVTQMEDIFKTFAVKLQQPDSEEKATVREDQEENVGFFNNNSSKCEPERLIPDNIRRLAEKYNFIFEEKGLLISLTGANEFLISVNTNSSTVVIQNPRKPVALRHSPCTIVQLDEFMKRMHEIRDSDL